MRTVGSVELLDLEAMSAGGLRDTGIDRIGASWLFDEERVFVVGGLPPGNDLAGEVLAMAIAPSLDDGDAPETWVRVVPRYLHGEAPLGDGRWLLVGGLAGEGGRLWATAAVERIDVRAREVARLPDLPFRSAEPLVLALGDGRVLVAGGYDAEVHGAAAVLDSDCIQWVAAPPLPSPRATLGAPIALGERHVLFAGGWAGLDSAPPRDGLILDTRSLEWQRADIDVPPGAAVVGLGDRLLVSGGYDEGGQVVGDNTVWTWAVEDG